MVETVRKVWRDQGGFTLIELMVVVAIIGLLAAFAVPRLWQAISDAKAAPGKVDLNTISGGLERHYFRDGAYPKVENSASDTEATLVKHALVPAFLKSATEFENGFDRRFIYGSDNRGTGYMFIDPANLAIHEGATSSQIQVTCTKYADGTNAPSGTFSFTIPVEKANSGTLVAGEELRIPTVVRFDVASGASRAYPDYASCTPTYVQDATVNVKFVTN